MNNTNPLQEAANQLALRGRYGDTMMVHMNPIEVDALAKLSPTGQLTKNPHTGQPEAFLPLLFSMLAPSLLAGTGMSALAASAIGSGLGTMAEGGSLQEGLTAGLMGGVTGGLLKGVMPEGLDLFGKGAGAEALPEMQAGTLAEGAIGPPAPVPVPQVPPVQVPNIVGPPMPPPDPTFGQNLMGGLESAVSPENLPTTVGQLGAGMVGEMYVPWDTPDEIDEESPYQYEGPYKPTEQRRMIAGMDPLQSAFEAEQQMLEGNVFPPGFNMRYGGLVKRLQKGGMARTQGQIENMAAEQRMRSDMNKQRALGNIPTNLSPEVQRMINAEIPEVLAAPVGMSEYVPTGVIAGGEPKRFRDYQPEGMLKGTMFDYVPDPVQTSQFLMDRLGRRRPNIEEVDMATLPRRKLMEPNR